MLTKRQKEILNYINKYYKKWGYSPTLEDIQKKFQYSSVSTAHFHINRLQEANYLTRHKNEPRSISIFENEPMIQIPLAGTIAAGSPIEAIEDKEYISIPKNKLPASENVFALKIVGDSMIDENIHDGDIVLVKKQSTAENGQKVVALIDNNEATLKKYYNEKNKIYLKPANKKIEPIIINKDHQLTEKLTIQGVVLDIIKKAPLNKEGSKREKSSDKNKKKPKGGCELTYPEKIDENSLLKQVNASKLELLEKHGSASENNLIYGDNLPILKNLYENKKIKGKVDLIYIDPPFGTGQEFVGYDEKNHYSDQIINTEFLEFLRRRLIFLRELLSENGSIYVHIDQKIGHYVKIILDEIFGEENFRNDITRIKCNPKNFKRKAFGNMKDVIYFYSKSKKNGKDPMTWTDYREPLSQEEIAKQFPKIDKNGYRYATTPLHAKGETQNGATGKTWKGLKPPKGRHWRYSPNELTRLDQQGLIEWSLTGNPRKIIYANENNGRKIQDVWDFRDPGYEKSHYPTEKNESLLNQIIKSSSKEGDMVLDCFAGSGTTLVAAEKLNRKWIGIDSNKSAIETTKNKILATEKNKGLFDYPASFEIYKAI
jgi:adenine-specific DNA-methyltransferase